MRTVGEVTNIPTERPGRIVALSVVYLAMFLTIMDGTIVLVALPAIQRDLGVSSENLTWIVNAYLVTLGGFIIVGGRAADLFGRKTLLIVGISLSITASFWCGVAPTWELLLIGRALQGLATAVLLPTSLSILTTSFPDGPERRKALSRWGGVNAVAATAALPVGGLLTDWFSWTAVFFFDTGLGAVVLALTLGFVRPDGGRAGRLDIGGAFALTGASIAITHLATGTGRYGWASTSTALAAAAAVVLVVALVVVEKRHDAPLLPPAVLKRRTTVIVSVAISVVEGVRLSVSYLLALHLQHGLGLSAFEAGLTFIPAVLAVATGSFLSYRLVQRLQYRVTILAALSVALTGVVCLAMAGTSDDHYAGAFAGILVMHVGVGCGLTTLTMRATANVPDGDAGLAAALVGISQRIGAGIWLALIIAFASPSLGSSSGASGAQFDGVQPALGALAVLVVLVMISQLLLEERRRGSSP